MSEQFIDVDSEEFSDAPRGLRDAYKKLQGRYTEVAQERDTFKGRAESSALGDVLKGFVKPERVKSALLSDGIDPLDSEAVGRWVTDNGNDFARGAATPNPSQPSAEEAAEAQAHRQIQSSSNLTQPADMTWVEAAQAALPENPTAAQVREAFLKAESTRS